MNAAYAFELSLLRYDVVSQRGPFPSDESVLATLLIKRGVSAERDKRIARLSAAERIFCINSIILGSIMWNNVVSN